MRHQRKHGKEQLSAAVKSAQPSGSWKENLWVNAVKTIAGAACSAILAYPFFSSSVNRHLTRLYRPANCAIFLSQMKVMTDSEAAANYPVYRSAYADMQGSPRDIENARDKLERLRDKKWILPGLRQTLGAIYLEMGSLKKAEDSVNSELHLIGCLDAKPESELKSMNLVDGPQGSTVEFREVLNRSRGMAEYNLASVYTQEGKLNKALEHLRLAIVGGFPASAEDLEVLERDRFLTPLHNLAEYEPIVAPLRLRLAR